MCESISKIILFVTNFLCLIVAAILMIVGGLLQWGQDSVKQNILPGIFQLVSKNDGQATITMQQIAQITDSYINVLSNSGIIIFVIGIIVFIIALCGLIGICCKEKIALIIYILFTTAIFILIVIFVVVFLVKRNQLQTDMTTSIFNILTSQYVFHNQSALNTTNGLDLTGIIDLIQARAGCCGSFNGTDYTIVKNKGNNLIPYTCCIMNGTGTFTPLYSNCTTNPSTINSNFNKGCSTILWDIINQFSSYAAYSLIGLAVILFILIVMAVILVRSFEDQK